MNNGCIKLSKEQLGRLSVDDIRILDLFSYAQHGGPDHRAWLRDTLIIHSQQWDNSKLLPSDFVINDD